MRFPPPAWTVTTAPIASRCVAVATRKSPIEWLSLSATVCRFGFIDEQRNGFVNVGDCHVGAAVSIRIECHQGAAKVRLSKVLAPESFRVDL